MIHSKVSLEELGHDLEGMEFVTDVESVRRMGVLRSEMKVAEVPMLLLFSSTDEMSQAKESSPDHLVSHHQNHQI
jgi:hypothetical protein